MESPSLVEQGPAVTLKQMEVALKQATKISEIDMRSVRSVGLDTPGPASADGVGEIEGSRMRSKVVHRDSIAVRREGVAQVALVGPPNAGKSSLLQALSQIQIKTGDYAFTTLRPVPALTRIGGVLVQHVDWSAIFWINVPVGIVGALVTIWAVAESRDPTSLTLDLPGVALITGGLFLLVWGLIETNDHSWASAYTIGFLTAAVVTLAAFVAWEARSANPMVPLEFFKRASFSASAAAWTWSLWTTFSLCSPACATRTASRR